MTIEEQLALDAKSKEELTTAMQAEFMEGEMSPFELSVLGVYGAMRRGLSKADACKKYNMTIHEYDTNIERCMKL